MQSTWRGADYFITFCRYGDYKIIQRSERGIVSNFNNVLYIPRLYYGVFSPDLAFSQGCTFKFDHITQVFFVILEVRVVAVA